MKGKLKKLISSVLIVSLVAGLAVVSTAAPATPEDSQNLIKASNFYEGNTAWRILPNSSVEEIGESVSNPVTYVEEEIPTIGKTRILQITQKVEDTNTNNALAIQNVRLTKGNTYKLSYWLKMNGEGSNFIAYYNPVGTGANRIVLEEGLSTTNGQWKKYEYTFNVEYDTGTDTEEYIRFEMLDVTGDEAVVFQLTDVHLEQTTKNYVPSVPSTRWQTNRNGNTVSMTNDEIQVITSGNANTNPNVSFTHDMEAGVTYIVSFHIEIDGDTGQTTQTNQYNFNIYELNGTPNNLMGINSTDNQMDYQQEWTVNSYTTNKTPTIRMYFARPSVSDTTIKYTITDLTIIKKSDSVEDTEEVKELVTEQSQTISTNGPIPSENLCADGSFELNEGVVGENFAMNTGFVNAKWKWGSGDSNVKNWAKWEVIEDATYGNAFKISSVQEEGALASNSWLNHPITWDTSKTYTISYRMKTETTKVTEFYLQAGSTNYGDIQNPNTEWKQYMIENYKPTASNDNFRFMVQMKAGQVLYLADVKITENTETQPSAGEVKVMHNGKINTEYTISFDLEIGGEGETYTDWNGGTYFDEYHRVVLCQRGFEGETIIAKLDETAEGKPFSYTYTPCAVDDGAEECAFVLYFAPTTGGTLTYTISNFSITYRDATVINEIAVTGADITSANPGAVTDTWGTNPNEAAYKLTQRWERVYKGIFATTDDSINTALTEAGVFTEFVSGADYRYSLVVKPSEGYYFSKTLSLKIGETLTEAECYYCADGSVIIYPADGEIFFTVIGDANKDGSADIKDLARMKKYVGGVSAEVYMKKCDFDETTVGITKEDVDGLRKHLVTK